MNITIIGGGNIGTQFAVHCAAKGHRVKIFSPKYHLFQKTLQISDQDGHIFLQGDIDIATDDPEKAFADTDLIFITVPAFMMENTANKIERFARKGLFACIAPGLGGGEFAFKKFIEDGGTVIGMQRVPSVARLVKYGKEVRAIGYRKDLFVSAIPSVQSEKAAEMISSIFDIRTHAVEDYLNITLTPSNPILHTTRLYRLFHDYSKGKTYKNLPLFYQEWDDETSELLIACDAEVQGLCHALSMFDLSYVRSLKEHYESRTKEDLTRKITSIEGFKGLETPHIKNEDGTYSPDLNSRYFVSDFTYGLNIIQQLAKLASFSTPQIDKLCAWYERINISEIKDFRLETFDIYTLEDMIKFYKTC